MSEGALWKPGIGRTHVYARRAAVVILAVVLACLAGVGLVMLRAPTAPLGRTAAVGRGAPNRHSTALVPSSLLSVCLNADRCV